MISAEKKLSDSREALSGNDLSPPGPEEIEVSLFGPGYGESVLLHIDGNWFIIDSCIDPTGSPAPLLYLQKLKIDIKTSVKQVIATHWHDDHIRGLSEIVKECESAEFICSGAIGLREFYTLVATYGIRPMMTSTGVQEFCKILDLLAQRSTHKKGRYPSPKRAVAERCLWRSTSMPTLCTIYSLSPSDSSIEKAQLELAELIPEKGKTKTQVPSLRPNHAAVVLLVKIGEDFILLGSDLEETKDHRSGWSAIINSQTRPQERASFFKIPHHGSASADHPDTWSLLLEKSPFSVLSPFASGGIFLPSKKDVIRISEKTDKAYSTAIPKQVPFKPIDKMVEKFLKERGLPISQVQFSTGQVRARGRYINGKLKWTVDLFRGALPLAKIYQ